MSVDISYKWFGLILFGWIAAVAHSAEGGYSNYLPGTYGDFAVAVAPTTELTLRSDLYTYRADSEQSVRSGQIEIGADLELDVNLLTLLYTPNVKVFGAQYGVGTVIPVVHADIEANLGGLIASDHDTGLGDTTFIPMILFWNSNNYHFTLGEYIVTPTGGYDSDALINTSLNYWTFDTNVAMTYLNLETGQDYAINVGYAYNTQNDKTDYQTGEEIHIDYMLNQFLSETFAIGLHGFYLDQVTGDSGNGALLGGFKAQAAGVGPALLWTSRVREQDISLIAKWLHEYDAENRMEGDHLFLSFALPL